MPYLLLILALIGPAAEAGEAPVDRAVVGHVVSARQIEGGWRVVVDRGRRDGIVGGDGAIERLGRRRTVLRLDEEPGPGISLHAKVREPAAGSVGFELAAEGVVVTDGRGRPLNPWRRAAADPNALADERICDLLAASVRSRAEVTDPAWAPLPAKRFRDRSLGEVVAGATAEEACGALYWLAFQGAAPGEVDGVAWFVDWARQGGPMAPGELWARSPALDDETFAQLAIRHGGDAHLSSEFYVLAWQVFERTGEPDLALAPIERLARATLNPETFYYAAWARGRIQRGLGDSEGAFGTWAEAFARVPASQRRGALQDLGLVALDTGRLDLSIRLYEAAIGEGGRSAVLRQQYGAALASADRYEEALPILEEAVAERERSPAPRERLEAGVGLFMIYRCQAELGRVDEAMATLDRLEQIGLANSFDALVASAYSGRGEQALEREDHAAAGEWFEREARTRPGAGAGGLALIRAGEAFWAAGDHARGFALVDEATDALKDDKWAKSRAQAFRALGDMERELGDVASAIALWREALHVVDGTPPTWTEASLWDAIGRAEASRDRLVEARAAFERSLAIGREMDDAMIQAGALFGLGLLGDDDPEAIRASVDLWLVDGNRGMAAALLSYLASIDHADAESLVAEALALLEAERPTLVGSDRQRNVDTTVGPLTTRAELAWARGEHAAAYAVLEEALALGPSQPWDIHSIQAGFDLRLGEAERALARITADPDDLGAEPARLTVAVAANLQLGRLDAALEAAHAYRRTAGAAGGIAEAVAYERLAGVYVARGELGEAERAARRAVAMADRAVSSKLAASARVVQAEIALDLGDAARALSIVEAALAVEPGTDVTIAALGLRARVSAAAGQADLARADLDRAHALAVAEIGPATATAVALRRALIELELGDAKAARSWLARAEGDGALSQAWAGLVAARIALAAGDLVAARSGLERVDAAGSEMAALGLRIEAQVALARLFGESEPDAAIAALQQVLALRDRQHAGLDPERALSIRLSDPAWDELAALLRSQGRPGEATALLADRAAPRAVQVAALAADLPLRDHLLRLGEQIPDLAARMAVPLDALVAVQATLAPNEAAILPVVLPDRVLVLVARGGRAAPSYHEVPVAESVVHARVEAVRRALETPGEGWGTSRGVRTVTTRGARLDPTQAAQDLHDLLIAPLASDLRGVETLIFAPGGRLRYVPFAALYDGERFLVERYRIALLSPSGAARPPRPLRRDGRLLALSNPDGSLPAASAEAQAVRRAWGRGRSAVHDGAAATEATLRREVRGASILHLATHGHLRNDDPRASWLLLAGPDGEARLTVPEISLLSLGNVDLAVLSACETAVGDGGEGSEIAGLAYQFENRGVSSIIASLWPVDDAATGELMIRLYRELRRNGATRAEALREAQTALIADPALRHPYYWAAFVLIGDWR